MSKNFKFSIVMAVYNNEKYLNEAIDSIINQTLNFNSNVQLILVDDASTDNSKGICLSYQKEYPNNITVISQEKAGSYSARNLGLDHACGEYINFMDAYDVLSKDCLQEVLDFYSRNPHDDYDFVALPVLFFDRVNSSHYLNYKFEECKGDVADVLEWPDFYQNFANSIFIRHSAIESIRFNAQASYMEDILFVNRILINKGKYGLVKNAKYFFRKSSDRNAANRNSKYTRQYYIERLKNGHLELIKSSLERYGKVPAFIQNVLLFNLNRIIEIKNFKKSISRALDSDEIDEFYLLLDEILSHMDVDVIKVHRSISSNIKKFLIFLKNREFHSETKGRLVLLKSGETTLRKLNSIKIILDIIELKNGFLNITGSYASICDSRYIQIKAIKNSNGEKSEFESTYYNYDKTPRRTQEVLGFPWFFFYTFDLKIPIAEDETASIEFKVIFNENDEDIAMNGHIMFRPYANMSEENPYFVKDSKIISFEDDRLYVDDYSLNSMIKHEIATLRNILGEFSSVTLTAALYRIAYIPLFILMGNKKIWIYTDRRNQSGDNGEHLFSYSIQQDDSVKKYFAIKSDCADYKRLKKTYGNRILRFGSAKHKLLHLLAEKVISSHPAINIFNPFLKDDDTIRNNDLNLYTGLITSQVYFLQHGIPKYAMPNWLRKYDHNIALLLAVSQQDYDSYVKYYNYDEEIIQILGYPRYDYLTNENLKKQIVIIFSWRHKIKTKESLIKSEYFARINNLINNERFIETARQYGYEIIVKMHPMMVQHIDLFDKNEYVTFDEATTYHELICDSALMITDYSSVAFDFAFLKKPVIYYQYGDDYHFDVETNYFDEKKSGFGEIIESESNLVDKIHHYLKNDCTMEEKFKDNVNKFFKYHDRNNSKRVYQWIKDH